MIYPRGLSNKEKFVLATVKATGVAFELKYNASLYSGGYILNIPSIKETWCLNTGITNRRRKIIETLSK